MSSRRRGILAALALVGGAAAAPTPDRVASWLQDVDRARNAFSESVITARASQISDGQVTGSADFQIYAKGEDRGLIVFRGGKNDGRKILNVGEKMWLIVPGASRALPITPNQRLLGGASVGDVARVQFAQDFKAAVRPGVEDIHGRPCRIVDLTAKSERAPYPRVVLWFDEKERVPCRLLFALPSGKLAKEVTFTKFRQSSGKTIAAEMEIRDLLANQPGTVTRLEYLDYRQAKIDDKFFTPEGALAF
ncbi:MAG TPA: outer membrane lipoprotein-sorting protein [Thermoanaerobaculia bacterium]|nr:outer membrane lipoprotein-sorting protein [Thermoanaerobaculia bacterium]